MNQEDFLDWIVEKLIERKSWQKSFIKIVGHQSIDEIQNWKDRHSSYILFDVTLSKRSLDKNIVYGKLYHGGVGICAQSYEDLKKGLFVASVLIRYYLYGKNKIITSFWDYDQPINRDDIAELFGKLFNQDIKTISSLFSDNIVSFWYYIGDKDSYIDIIEYQKRGKINAPYDTILEIKNEIMRSSRAYTW